MGQHGPHEKNHNIECQVQYIRLTRCLVRGGVGVNPSPHDQNHFQMPRHVKPIDTMIFPNFTYSLRVTNKLWKDGSNRQTLGRRFQATQRRSKRVATPPYGSAGGVSATFHTRGFDGFGRVDVVFLSTETHKKCKSARRRRNMRSAVQYERPKPVAARSMFTLCLRNTACID